MNVTREQRHTRTHRCPICDGADGDPRGKGKRCNGFTPNDEYVHCSREDLAGGIEANGAGLYAHRMHGSCHCGQTHGEARSGSSASTIEATYDYTDANGALLFQVVRKSGKQFRQRKPDGAGGWIWKLGDVPRVPYRLRELVEDDGDRVVYIVEGEKDADSLASRGFLATCNPGGAGKWSGVADLARETLAGRDIIVVADRDDVGRRHALEVAESLRSVARSLVTLTPPAPFKDASDVLRAGYTLTQLVALGTIVDPADTPSNDEPDPPYIIESAAEIATPNPPLEWLCPGLRLARSSITIVGGYGYSRKTLYAQAMALAVASGTRVLGVYSVDHQPVLHIDYEQGKRITRDRYQRLARAAGIELRDALLSVVTFPRFKLSSPEARDQLRRLLEETGAKLVILDSLRASVSGVEENSSEIREYIDVVGTECKRVDAAAIIIHHARKPSDGKPGGKYSLRGSGAIFDACDGVFIFSGEKGQPTTVEHEKDRLMGTELDAFGLNSEDVSDGNDPRWGLRLVHQEPQQMREAEDAKRVAADAAKRAAKESARDATEAERAAKETAKRARKEAEGAAKVAERFADEETALRGCVAADPGINEGRLLSAMRARLGSCSDAIGRTAIERARLAGWLEVKPGAKSAKLHHLKDSAS